MYTYIHGPFFSSFCVLVNSNTLIYFQQQLVIYIIYILNVKFLLIDIILIMYDNNVDVSYYDLFFHFFRPPFFFFGLLLRCATFLLLKIKWSRIFFCCFFAIFASLNIRFLIFMAAIRRCV